MLEIYLLILGIVYQIDGLRAAITLLMVSQGEYSIKHLALHGLAGFRRVAKSIHAFYKILELGWVQRSIWIVHVHFLGSSRLDYYPIPGAR